MNSTISVVCPVRNMEGKLQNLREWVLQCDSTFQIVLVCDSSTDKTIEELQSIKSENPFLNMIILNGNYGSPGSARNAGLAQTEGKWVIFWDSDDLGNPRLLSNEVKNYNYNTSDAIVFGFEIYSGSRKVKPWTVWPNGKKECIEKTSLNPGIWRFCFKRTSIRNLKFPNLRMAEDQLFINEFIQQSPQVKFNNSVIYNYFVNLENQLTSNIFALGDLSRAADVLSGVIGKKNELQVFTIRIFGKILLTQIKKCELKIKFLAVFKLIKLMAWHPREIFKLISDIILEKIK
jgi:glycosyltransferase involved in cell wall biosynthesis